MLFPMSMFKKPPYIHGETTMEEFFEDQHYRRRFLRKYSPKVFPIIKKCKNINCTNYHDNKNSFCSEECKEIYKGPFYIAEAKEDITCEKCLYGYKHESGFLAFKYHCVDDMQTEGGKKEFLVGPKDWCHFFVRRR